MKSVVLFLISVVCGFTIVFLLLQTVAKKTETTVLKTPLPITSAYSIAKPPKNALPGQIISLLGDVSWQSRMATEPAKISSQQKIQQGESIVTASGSATIAFPSTASISIQKDASLDIIQTLPAGFVFTQKKGPISYKRIGSIPLAIRSLHLLTDIKWGEITEDVDIDEKTVTIRVIDGEVTVAYNDQDYLTQTLSAKTGDTLYFDDETRELRIK